MDVAKVEKGDKRTCDPRNVDVAITPNHYCNRYMWEAVTCSGVASSRKKTTTDWLLMRLTDCTTPPT